MMKQVSNRRSTVVVSSNGIITICTPPTGWAPRVKMMGMAHLLIMMIELSAKTWYRLANDARGEHVMLYRSNIDAVLAEISHTNVGRRFRPAELRLVLLRRILVVCCR